jgi:pimeloyl-ACP methyl ester carboxylesterase
VGVLTSVASRSTAGVFLAAILVGGTFIGRRRSVTWFVPAIAARFPFTQPNLQRWQVLASPAAASLPSGIVRNHMQLSPFQIAVPDDAIADLKTRLQRVRWPDQPDDVGWDHGTDLAYVQDLVRYWREEYDWRRAEHHLNSFSQFTATVRGLRIHFIYERAKQGGGLPLVITHGWPGTFAEMTRLIPLLTRALNTRDLPFDVIVPSLPGYGFSERPTRTGMHVAAIADLWAELMSGLGYERFLAQGGDLGAAVTMSLASRFPERVRGIHLNFVPNSYQPPVEPAGEAITDEERAYLERRSAWADAEGAYAHIQGTRPQTLGYALNDSPVGLAAWFTEKYRLWSDCQGDIGSVYSKDELLTNISLYWFAETITSSFRLYRETRQNPLRFAPNDRVAVPLAVAQFPKEVWMPPRSWVERVFTGVRQWSRMPRGGHFAAFEQPQLLADDIRAFARTL